MICPSFYWVSWDCCCLCLRREKNLSSDFLRRQIKLSLSILSSIIKSITLYHLFFLSFTATIPKCGGCHEFILDRFILKVSDRTWHAKCLQCNDCHAQLNEKCFIRNGQLFCKDDFFKWVKGSLWVKRFRDWCQMVEWKWQRKLRSEWKESFGNCETV